ncbi:hypothetical protein SprV_0100325900 [Sparganum proliferum]
MSPVVPYLLLPRLQPLSHRPVFFLFSPCPLPPTAISDSSTFATGRIHFSTDPVYITRSGRHVHSLACRYRLRLASICWHPTLTCGSSELGSAERPHPGSLLCPPILYFRGSDESLRHGVFAVTIGVKQGCVLAPTLFSLMSSAMQMNAYRDKRPWIHIAYRTGGQLLNHRRVQFQSRVSITTVHELLFADDCAPNATSECGMQRCINLFSAACENFDLIINTEKTPTASSAAKAKRETRRRRLTSPTPNHLQRVRDVNGYPGRQLDLLDTYGPTAAPALHQPSSLRPPLLRLPRRQLTLAALPNHHYHPPPPPSPPPPSPPPPPQRLPLWRLPYPSTLHTILTLTNAKTPTVNTSYKDPMYNCPHCDRTFTSHTGLVGHLRIHRTETGKPVPGAPTYTGRIHLHFPDCPSTFMHRMGLFSHTRILESGTDRSTDIPSTSSTPTMLSPPAPSSPSLRLILTPPTLHVHTVLIHSPHASAWSVTCESTAQRLAGQCLEHQSKLVTSASIAHIAFAHLFTAWV